MKKLIVLLWLLPAIARAQLPVIDFTNLSKTNEISKNIFSIYLESFVKFIHNLWGFL